MTHLTMAKEQSLWDISYGIYTIERLPKGSKRTPKWDLHSTAKDKAKAEEYAKTLAAQPYFDHIEIQEFKICPETKQRSVNKIKSYSRKSSVMKFVAGVSVLVLAVLFFLA